MRLRHLVVSLCLLVSAACADHGADRLQVTVVDGSGTRVAYATVVLGDQNGTLQEVHTTSDSGATAFGAPPPNATVTATYSCFANNRTYYSVDIAYGVNVAAVTLNVSTCSELNQSVAVSLVNQVAGATDYDITLGPITYSTATGRTMDVYELQDDGTISVLASGYDASGALIGYGLALDQPVAGPIAVTIDQTDQVQQTHQFANPPANIASYAVFASLYRKHAATNPPFNFAWGAAPLPASVTTYAIDRLADQYLFGASVMLDQDNDGSAEATVGISRYQRTASAQLFDFALAPAIPKNLAFTPQANGRPLFSWTDADSAATTQTLTLWHSSATPQRTALSCTMTAPPRTTILVFPELPAELAAFRPTAFASLALQTVKFDLPTSYAGYLQALAANSGRFYEAAGLSSYTFSTIALQP